MGEWGTDYILMSDFLQKRADFISDFLQNHFFVEI